MSSFTRPQIYKTQSKGKSGGSVSHGKGRKKNQKMPICQYGSACTRGKQCIYRHPKKAKEDPNQLKNVCPHYLSGICEYGKNCEHRHPSEQECLEYRARFAGQICRNGEACTTFSCLYAHPARDMMEQYNAQMEQYNIQLAATLEATTLSVGASEWTPPWQTATEEIADPTLTPQNWPKANDKKKGLGKISNKKTYAEIPIEVWTPNYCRNPQHFNIVDPLERYREVNKNSASNVIDVHYQTGASVLRVLDLLLPQYEGEDVWIVTGTGHHKGGHQKSGVLMKTVEEYLTNQEHTFLYGKSGGQTGAFYVVGRR